MLGIIHIKYNISLGLSPTPPPTTAASISKSNMAGRINDREFLKVNYP